MKTLSYTIPLAIGLLAAATPAQAVFLKTKNPVSLIEDLTARKVGDIVTIEVQEAHKVKNEDKVNRTSSTGLAARLEDYSLSRSSFLTNTLPAIDARSSREQIGEAKQEKDSTLTAKISVVVVDVQPNGNMVVARNPRSDHRRREEDATHQRSDPSPRRRERQHGAILSRR